MTFKKPRNQTLPSETHKLIYISKIHILLNCVMHFPVQSMNPCHFLPIRCKTNPIAVYTNPRTRKSLLNLFVLKPSCSLYGYNALESNWNLFNVFLRVVENCLCLLWAYYNHQLRVQEYSYMQFFSEQLAFSFGKWLMQSFPYLPSCDKSAFVFTCQSKHNALLTVPYLGP